MSGKRNQRWQKCEIPKIVLGEWKRKGAVAVACEACMGGGQRLICVLASLDPSGPNGGNELHLSISVSVAGVRVPPDHHDLEMVKARWNLRNAEYEAFQFEQGYGVHIWASESLLLSSR